MKKIILLYLFIVFNAYATDESVLIYHPTQTSDRISYEYDLNNLQLIKKDEFNFEQYNKQNLYEIGIGGQVVQYEKKIGTLVEEFSPSAFIRHKYYLSDNFILDFNAIINKNSFILKESLEPSIHFNKTHFFIFGMAGQEISLADQKNSGFLFVNGGLGVRQFIGSWSLDLKVLKPIKSISPELGFEVNLIKYSNKSKYFGVSIHQDQNIPINQKYGNDKYSASGVSLFFGF